jgi:hypothetical protein
VARIKHEQTKTFMKNKRKTLTAIV